MLERRRPKPLGLGQREGCDAPVAGVTWEAEWDLGLSSPASHSLLGQDWDGGGGPARKIIRLGRG